MRNRTYARKFGSYRDFNGAGHTPSQPGDAACAASNVNLSQKATDESLDPSGSQKQLAYFLLEKPMTLQANSNAFQTSSSSVGIAPYLGQRYDTRNPDLGILMSFSSGAAAGPAQVGARSSSFWRESLTLVEQYLVFGRRKVSANDQVYRCGDAFDTLYLISSGLFKIVNLAPDGREQPAGLFLKGDWLGFDGIPKGHYGCSAIALDSGEVWTIRYDALLQASAKEPMLMRVLLAAMSSQLAHCLQMPGWLTFCCSGRTRWLNVGCGQTRSMCT